MLFLLGISRILWCLWMVICGEVVVSWWWNVGNYRTLFWGWKIGQGFEVYFWLGEEPRFAGANAHLSDDKTVAKMGHPISKMGTRCGDPR
jgi:hypothetical protein